MEEEEEEGQTCSFLILADAEEEDVEDTRRNNGKLPKIGYILRG